MTINQNLLPSSKHSLKSPHSMTPEFICVHNTANDAPAKNEISYMVTNNLQTSFHFAVDDKEIWQGLPLNRNGWHAGDGANGTGNRKSIGIEICYSKSGGVRFTQAEERAAKLIAQLLKERGWGIDRVKKHQDFSGKNCPHRTLSLGWNRYLDLIKNHTDSGGQQNMSKELESCQKDRLKFWDERDGILRLLDLDPGQISGDVVEAAKRVVSGLRSRITDLGNQLGKAQAEVKESQESLSRSKSELLVLSDRIKVLENQAIKRQSEITEIAEAKRTQGIELEQLKVQYDTLKQQQAQGEITLSFLEVFKLFLNQKITIKR